MPTCDRTMLDELLRTAHRLADASGPVILDRFRKAMTVDNKAGNGSFDPVTEADREAERIIRRCLAEWHPDHAILGEEMGATAGTSPYTWVLDPIDGTRAFMTGMPLWGTLIGVTCEGLAVAGMMDQPYTRERVWSTGTGALWRGIDQSVQPIRTASCPHLGEARFTTTSPDLFATSDAQDVFGHLKAGARLTRFGGDCYAYCLLAAGHIDLVVEAGLQPYDIVALVPIIEEAGGVVTTWSGERPEAGGRIVASGDPRLHETVLAMMATK